MGFQKIFLFQNNEKNITNKVQAPDFMYLSYFKSSHFPLNSAYLWYISYGQYQMVHIIWKILDSSYDMDHIV